MDYEDYDDEPGLPHVTVDAELRLNTPELSLTAKVGEDRVADLIVQAAVNKLAKGDPWNDLRKRVEKITEEEIRARVAEQIAQAMNSGFRRTNTYGEPYGEPTTLRAVIAEEASKALTKAADPYNSRESVIRKLVREEVEKALKAELSEAIAQEKAKVVAAVRGKTAEIITQAVTAGLGGK